MKAHFVTLAKYNEWANSRLYRMARALPDEAYRRHVGAYFGSLHGTLNHLLTADRIWMRRLTRMGEHPGKLNATACDDLQSLRIARQTEDERIVSFVERLEEEEFAKQWDYQTLNGTPQRQPIGEILAHLFNHQTHHRGQAHMILTVLGVAEPDPLDLLIMLRTRDVSGVG
ncbi:MAG: DinB family protein [Steroidobacteraceae bacterium]